MIVVQRSDFEISMLSIFLHFSDSVLTLKTNVLHLILYANTPKPSLNLWWNTRPPLDSRPTYPTATWYPQVLIQRHLKLSMFRAEQLLSPDLLQAFTPQLLLAKPLFPRTLAKKLTVIPAYSLSLTLPIQQPTLVGPNFKIYSESHWSCHYLTTPVWIIIILHLDYCHSLLTGLPVCLSHLYSLFSA